MKLTVLQENLVKVVQDVARFVPAKPQIPILSCVLFRAENGRLELVATDLAVSVKTSCGGKIEASGECAVPARTFLEYISTLASGPLELEVVGGELSVRGKKSTSAFQSMSAKEFPSVGKESRVWVEIETADFLELVEKGGLAASSDESRPVFASLYWEIDPEYLQVVSTDGYRLSRKRVKNPGWDQSSFLVPAKIMREIARIIGKNKQKKVSLCVTGDGVLAVSAGEYEFTMRLIEGNFPAYRNILPASFACAMSMEREEFVAAMKSVMVFSRESSGVVKLKKTDSELSLAAASAALGSGEAVVSIFDVEGGENAIAFNGKYLLDVFSSLHAQTLRFQMNESLKPGLFTIEKDDSFLYLVMPFRT